MSFTAQLPKKVRKELAGLAQEVQKRVIKAIERLETEPRPVGAIMLEGQDNRYRIRFPKKQHAELTEILG